MRKVQANKSKYYLAVAALLIGVGLLAPRASSQITQTQAVTTPTIKLTEDNTVNFRGPVSDESVVRAMLALQAAVEKRGAAEYPIYLVIDSPGGSIMAGMDLIAYLRTQTNVQTITIFAASMASAIVNGNPGTRLVTEDGVSMFHRAAGAFQGQFNDGEVESRLILWRRIVTQMEQTNATRLGISLEVYKQRVKDEWWIFGTDNLVQRTADAVVQIYCSPELVAREEEVLVVNQFFSTKAVYSGCPLFRSAIRTIED